MELPHECDGAEKTGGTCDTTGEDVTEIMHLQIHPANADENDYQQANRNGCTALSPFLFEHSRG
jgi:hypothetical protein